VKRIISILSLCSNMLNNGSPLRDEIQICEIEKGDDLQLKAIAMDSSNGSLVGITDGCNGNSIYWQSSNGEISENLSFRPVLIHAFKMIDSTPWTRWWRDPIRASDWIPYLLLSSCLTHWAVHWSPRDRCTLCYPERKKFPITGIQLFVIFLEYLSTPLPPIKHSLNHLCSSIRFLRSEDQDCRAPEWEQRKVERGSRIVTQG